MSNSVMPLAMSRPGKLLRVVAINAGWGLQRRLADLGLTHGVQIRVMSGQCCGSVLIDLRGSRVGLGRGVAQKILVKEAEDG
jgi:ferrous iron transport protein A